MPPRPIRIGILGAESTHASAFAMLFNRRRAAPGCRVEWIWGETTALARKPARAAGIPNVAAKPRDMLGKVDALIVCHRSPDPHVAAARPFVSRGIPVYVGKPFCRRAAEGRALLALARKEKVPVASFGALTLQRSFASFRTGLPKLGKILAGSTYGPCDVDSRYGGIYFYGIHQVEMALAAFGSRVEWAQVERTPKGAVGLLGFSGGTVAALHLFKDTKAFSIGAVGEKKALRTEIRFDRSPYLSSVQRIAAMFRSGRSPMDEAAMLRPVRVLEALERSLRSGKRVAVARS